MYKALIVFFVLAVYQFTGVARLHSLPIVPGETYTATCMFVADMVGSERMHESRFCQGA